MAVFFKGVGPVARPSLSAPLRGVNNQPCEMQAVKFMLAPVERVHQVLDKGYY